VSIEELRILPPLAVGRLGAAPTPMDNYDMVVDPNEPLAFRTLTPAPTFDVDPDSGVIRRVFTPAPNELVFTERGSVRPVAPFLEVWALTTDGALEPLTADLLKTADLTPADVTWRVHVGNHKLYRRTGDANDKIEAEPPPFSDHARHALEGTSEHFLPDKKLPLGHVQYIQPTDEFPEIRLRFTPAGGHVYGSTKVQPPAPDPNVVDFLYDANKGSWLGYWEASAGEPQYTIPAQIYAGEDATRDGRDGWQSKGYLDDECDGLVHVALTVAGRELSAYARIGAGPPAYAPDGLPIRTIAQELEQALLGHDVDPSEASAAEVEEIVRRAFETIRLMNTVVMNGNPIDGRTRVASTMVAQDTNDTGRMWEPIMATSLVDRIALANLHESLLVALRSGTAPWFADVLRQYDEIGDLTTKGRRKMPAMMRNADGRGLALTRRQVSVVRGVAQRSVSPGEDA
jgi:hypothetical protein